MFFILKIKHHGQIQRRKGEKNHSKAHYSSIAISTVFLILINCLLMYHHVFKLSKLQCVHLLYCSFLLYRNPQCASPTL